MPADLADIERAQQKAAQVASAADAINRIVKEAHEAGLVVELRVDVVCQVGAPTRHVLRATASLPLDSNQGVD